jgi:uncharacterized membrane protein
MGAIVVLASLSIAGAYAATLLFLDSQTKLRAHERHLAEARVKSLTQVEARELVETVAKLRASVERLETIAAFRSN